MKSRSKYQVSVRPKAIRSVHARGTDEMSVEAEVDARPSIQILPGGFRVLSIAGPGLWSKLVMTEKEAERIALALWGIEKPKPGTQVVHFHRKARTGAEA